MWKTIKYLTNNSDSPTIQTIDTPEDSTIKWNDIKSHTNLNFKAIDDIELMNK